jgi:hypothetical protein
VAAFQNECQELVKRTNTRRPLLKWRQGLGCFLGGVVLVAAGGFLVEAGALNEAVRARVETGFVAVVAF